MAKQDSMPFAGMIDGVRVLSFAHYLQGPSGVQMLADLGADVIKVEPPQGSFERHWSGSNVRRHGESVFFLCANRNKRSLCLDIKSDAGAQVIRDLLPTRDVLVENFRPGVMERLGFGYDAVQKVNPAIVYASSTGYGADGPYRDRPGQDMLIQAMSGLAAVSGPDSGPPVPAGVAAVDQHGAALLAMGVLAALFRREKSGRGCLVELNLLNSALDLQMEALTYFLNGAVKPPRSRTGMGSWFHPAPYGVYPTADGYIALSLNPVERMAKVLNCPELEPYTDCDSYEERDAISSLIMDALRQHPTEHWMNVFGPAGVWYAPVNDYPDLTEDPQIAHNRVFLDATDHAGRPIRLVNHPLRYDGAIPPVRRPPPALGQHSLEILRELGYSEDKVQEMAASGAVRPPPKHL